MRTTEATQAEAITRLINEIRSSFHQLKVLAQELHGGSELTAARRGVMVDLVTRGDQTVPALAALRPVSRQNIQVVVNGLSEDRWVRLLDNPGHKRSKLVSPTQKGRAKIRRMLEQERLLLASLELRHTKEDVIRAAEVLHEMRAVLEDLRTSARDD